MSKQILINQYIKSDLNCKLTTLASYWDKTLAQLIVSTFSRKKTFLISFKERNTHFSHVFHYSKIIKILEKVNIDKYLFINKYTNSKLPPIFTNWFTFSLMSHNYHHRLPLKKTFKPLVSKQHHMKKNYFVYVAIRTWSNIQKEMKGVMLHTLSLVKLKSLLTEFYLNKYKIS